MPSLLFYAFIAWVLHETSGHYDAFWAVVLTLVFGVYLALAAAPAAWGQRLDSPRARRLLPGLIAVWFSFLLWRAPGVIYPIAAERAALLSWLTAASLAAVTLSVVSAALTGHSAWKGAAFWLAAGLLFAGRAAVLYASPDPYIDVFTLTNQGADYVLVGLNPYSQSYTDLYAGASGYAPGPHYWPGYYAWSAPFRALGDIRLGSIAADLLTLLFLFKMVLRQGGDADAARTAGLLWLTFPVSLFVLEQAWIDPAIVAMTAALGWCLLERRWAPAGALLGFSAAVKQYMPLLSVITLLFVYRQYGRRAFLAVLAPALAVFGLVMIPFLVLDPPAFLQHTVWIYLQRGMRLDALTFPAFLANAYGLHLPDWALAAVYAAGLLAGAALALRGRAALQAWAGALAAVFGTVFVFGKQAFCNYYYLLAFMVLLRALDGPSGGRRTGAALFARRLQDEPDPLVADD